MLLALLAICSNNTIVSVGSLSEHLIHAVAADVDTPPSFVRVSAGENLVATRTSSTKHSDTSTARLLAVCPAIIASDDATALKRERCHILRPHSFSLASRPSRAPPADLVGKLDMVCALS